MINIKLMKLNFDTPTDTDSDWREDIIGRRKRYYRKMHFSAKRGIEIACRLSVSPSVCNAGGSGSNT